jgi:protein-S-isoprenylcysteine O-methyltransferase Ste14
VTLLHAKIVWLIGTVLWFAVRYPHQRRSHQVAKASSKDRKRERATLAVTGLLVHVVPLVYVLTGWPRFADYAFQPALAVIGAAVFAAALWLFHRSHADLGANWSIALDIRAKHALVTNGVYRLVRHPMYSAFWLNALAQALLLPNFVAGPAGLVGIAVLYFSRVAREERMMLETFGEEYRAYMSRSARLIPWIY